MAHLDVDHRLPGQPLMWAFLLCVSVSHAGGVALDRIDLLSETDGSWQHDELPRAGISPRFVGVRFVEQVQPVIAFDRVQLGLSLRSQSLRWAQPLGDSTLVLNGGAQFAAGCPNGVVLGGAWRPGALRLGASLSVSSAAHWGRPVWDGWRVLPTIGIGIGRHARPRAPWM